LRARQLTFAGIDERSLSAGVEMILAGWAGTNATAEDFEETERDPVMQTKPLFAC
jgi:hypothetical protein